MMMMMMMMMMVLRRGARFAGKWNQSSCLPQDGLGSKSRRNAKLQQQGKKNEKRMQVRKNT
jgi:hypothetical protein